MTNDPDEIARLRRAFDALPKVQGHGDHAVIRHPNIKPEWVMQILREPFHRYEFHRYEELGRDRQWHTIVVGRVPESNQWIKLVFISEPEKEALLTVYNDRRLEKRYGGRPWDIQ